MQLKKLSRIFICLLFLYIGLEVTINQTSKGHHINYQVKDEKQKITIDENYSKKNNYRYDLIYEVNGIKFYQTFLKNLKNRNYLVQKVRYVEDSKYKCIYPIYKEQSIKLDAICYDGKYYYPYQTIKGNSLDIDNFINSIKEYPFKDKNEENGIKKNNVTIFLDNLIKGHKLFLENYKGLYIIDDNGKLENITLFENDIYKKTIHGFTNQYYVVANYNNLYATNELLSVSLKDGKVKTLKKKDALSFDSYTQGVIENKLYIVDKSNKVQYKIDPKSEVIKKIGDENQKLSVFKEGKFIKKNYYQAIQEKVLFAPNAISTNFKEKEYDKVDYVKSKKLIYYYLYEKEDSEYHVYRNLKGQDIIVSLFSVSNLNDVYYVDDFVYFKKDENIYCYSDETGINKVLNYRELKFNDNLAFYVAS